jgi:hypothetical protein
VGPDCRVAIVKQVRLDECIFAILKAVGPQTTRPKLQEHGRAVVGTAARRCNGEPVRNGTGSRRRGEEAARQKVGGNGNGGGEAVIARDLQRSQGCVQGRREGLP